jgi:hypothetical protein
MTESQSKRQREQLSYLKRSDRIADSSVVSFEIG